MFETLILIGAMFCAPSTSLGLRLFSIPSASMEPTLHLGTTVAAYRCAYGLSRASFDAVELPIALRWPNLMPASGDVIIFRLQEQRSTFYVKRVVGLPGDRVQLTGGRLLINGVPMPREQQPPVLVEDAYGKQVEAATYRETLAGGRSHLLMERDGDAGLLENTALFEVPPGHLFVLGDNRDNSVDSRMPPDQGGTGFVPVQNIFGRVLTEVAWPYGQPKR